MILIVVMCKLTNLNTVLVIIQTWFNPKAHHSGEICGEDFAVELNTDALVIFNERYADKNDQGQVLESPEQAVDRICTTAASAEKSPELAEYWAEVFKQVIDNKWFLPSTPIWSNMGKHDHMQQPGACFVLNLPDSLQGMYQTLLETAVISKYGGGVGYNFSQIRPRGDLIHSTKGRASGVVELIRLYDHSATMISQAGIRRGAYMGILNCDHPEIVEFIRCKTGGGLGNFNLSVGISDAFMNAVINDEKWELRFENQVRQILPASQIWEDIVSSAWSCGDPGLIFLDTIQRNNPIPGRPVNCTNPCGEQPLSPGESCLLGSINLALMVDQYTHAINWPLLKHTAQVAVRFLDNLIDKAEYPFAYIAEHTRASRKIGIGIMGLHDLLLKLKTPYDSDEGTKYASEIMSFIRNTVDQATCDLGREKGTFPLWGESVFAAGKVPRRNASCLTIAPTGTIALLAGVEGYGIEPIFAIAYKKSFFRQGAIESFDFVSPLFIASCQERGVSREALQEAASLGSCQGVDAIPIDIRRLFKGAREIDPMDHLAMQIAVQKWVDNAISKTINLPANADKGLISDIYIKAWEQGLKGISIFRAGSKTGVIEIGSQIS